MNDLYPKFELLLQTAGFSDRKEREEIINAISSEVIKRAFEKNGGKYSHEEFMKKLAEASPEISKSVLASYKEVVTEFMAAGLAHATPEEIQRFQSLSKMLNGEV